jgi:hypothetical protein
MTNYRDLVFTPAHKAAMLAATDLLAYRIGYIDEAGIAHV